MRCSLVIFCYLWFNEIMEFAQLKSSLKTQVSPAYLIYGSDYFLINKAIQLIQNALPGAEVSKFDAETPASDVAAALMTTTFFAVNRLVIYAPDSKADWTALNQALQQPTPGSVLVVLDYHDKATANVKAAIPVDCNPMKPEILVPLIAKQIAPKTITRAAADYLVEATGGYYSLIDNELQKLLAFYADLPTFEVKHLQPYLTKTLDYQIYELGAAILQHNVTAAASMLDYLLDGNQNEYMIFGGIMNQLRRAYYATASHADINVVGKILGCSPYAIKYSRRDFGADPVGVRNCYARGLDLEYQIKSGQLSVSNALAALIYR